MAEDYRKSVLPNGIRVVTERMPHVRSVAVGVWVETGSRHESEHRGGISHLIEHLVFKGTATRTAQDIARAMDSVGGQMDAFTTKEHTCFYVQVLDEHLPMAVDLLTDILLHPLFDGEELEREKSVVLQEIKMVEDTPDDVIHDIFAAQVWPGHPLGRPILGTRDLVTGFGRETIAGHFSEEYAPPRILIAVAGNVTHDRVVELFGRGFDGFSHEPAPRAHTPARLTPGVNIVHKTLEQVHVVLGFPGLHQCAPERYALFLLNDIVGGSMSSRLFQEVRERQGLVYSIHSGVQAYSDTGTIYVYAATDAGNFAKVLKSTLKELREVKKSGVTEDELRRAKDHLKGSLMLSLESTSSRMNRLAKHEMHFGSFFTLDMMLASIDRVAHEEVQALVSELLDEDQLALTTLGPLDRRNLPAELRN
ncbi:MAG TPA: pitrilysin family protein [Methylomirabilota bacterium]|jgi:predicted Zn-dependent peptidase|nr:pitrilysin family protein [Methylomirabilota bacterium]